MIELAKAFGLKKFPGKAISLALITALVSTSALPLASARAGHRDGWHGGDVLAASVIGFAIGAVVAD